MPESSQLKTAVDTFPGLLECVIYFICLALPHLKDITTLEETHTLASNNMVRSVLSGQTILGN